MPGVTELLYGIFGPPNRCAQTSTEKGELTTRPLGRDVCLTDFQDHLAGEISLSAYALRPDSTVNWIAWDIDIKDEMRAKEICLAILDSAGQALPVIEKTGGKGYHVWIFLDSPLPAGEAKAFAEHIKSGLRLSEGEEKLVEIFPRQDRLTATRPWGSCLRIPLGLHPVHRNRSIFINPTTWQELEVNIALSMVTAAETVRSMATRLAASGALQQPNLIGILKPHWQPGQRHELALGLAGFLLHSGWTEERTRDLITRLCLEAGDTEQADRLAAVRDTYERARQNGKESVAGLAILQRYLPAHVISAVVSQAPVTTELIQIIDQIRLDKIPQFLKIRSATNAILQALNSRGTLFIHDGALHFFDAQKGIVLGIDDERWDARLWCEAGINPVEPWGAQVRRSFILQALESAPHKRAARLFHYSDEEGVLRVYLDNSDVYRLDGETITRERNGEADVFFLFNYGWEDTRLPDLSDDEAEIINPLTILLDNPKLFEDPETAQPLATWVYLFPFADLVTVRPILGILGPGGSGKTSLLRRLLQFFEGPLTDVLGFAADKPDALRASIFQHRLLALDNLERSHAGFLVEMMHVLSTRAHLELRRLYSTNAIFRIRPDCWVAFTAVQMPWTEETLYSRVLPIQLSALPAFVPESARRREFLHALPAAWAGFLRYLNRALPVVKQPISVETVTRLADFIALGTQLSQVPELGISAEYLADLEPRLMWEQTTMLGEVSPFVQLLDLWLEANPNPPPVTASDLFIELRTLAVTHHVHWPFQSARGVAQHIGSLRNYLEREYGMEIVRSAAASDKKLRYRFRRPAQPAWVPASAEEDENGE